MEDVSNYMFTIITVYYANDTDVYFWVLRLIVVVADIGASFQVLNRFLWSCE